MRSDADTKKWGTIYLGGSKETTLESLDTMQAAARQDQWNQRTQNDYLDRVRERATDRAREILGAAHTERQAILDEARTDAERIRLETQVQYDKADKALADAEAIRGQAQALKDEAEAIRNAAQEEGFNTGLANARDELDAFRGAMGASIAVVLQSIERQNSAIFGAWREELVALVQTCVNKGTEWVLQDQHEAVLRALVMESVRQLDNRHTVTLRIHPDDEAAVADMFTAAREAMPDVDRWIVQGDASVALGGLIAESPSSTVDNRVGLRNALVEGILQHLNLPEGEAEVIAAQAVHDVIREQVAHIETLAPPVPEQYLSEPSEHSEQPENAEQGEMSATNPEASQEHLHTPPTPAPLNESDVPDSMPDMLQTTADLLANAEHAASLEAMADSTIARDVPPDASLAPSDQPTRDTDAPDLSPMESEHIDGTHEAPKHTQSMGADTANPQAVASSLSSPEDSAAMPEPATPLNTFSADAPPSAPSTPAADAPAMPFEAPVTSQAAPSLAELEEELLPLPEENSDAVNAVLAGGGFLSDDDTLGPRS